LELCDVCKTLDFQPHKYRYDAKQVVGTAASIKARSKHCDFCRFIARNCVATVSAGRDPQHVEVYLHTHTLGTKPNSEYPNNADIEVNSIRVDSNKGSGMVYLTPCMVPVPSVGKYWSSPSVFLDDRIPKFSGRLVRPRVSIQLPRKWLDLCIEKHGNSCENPSWIQSHEHPVNMRLINVREMCVVKARQEWSYICLSYVWGASTLQEQSRALQTTIQALEHPGSLHKINLPRTLLDAIRFVRDMGELYLWVDSLCIVQDDDYERTAQISQMDLIYARALLTVAVVASEDCTSGIPHLYREIRNPKQDHVQISPGFGVMLSESNGFYKEDERWATRGWTYQELHLSRRVLMAFKEMLHWRCECDYWNEKTCLEPSNSASKACRSHLSISLNLTSFLPRFDPTNLSNHVYYFNRSRHFTNEGDTLDGFRGILKRMEHVSGIGFHWCLSRQNFHFALLWRDGCSGPWRRNLRRQSYCRLMSPDGDLYSVRLPSWSWIGWSTPLHSPIYNAEEARKTLKKYGIKDIDWATQWFRLGTDGQLSEIEQSPLYKH
jgi:Heterokaryon incompatibility protein (HET)